MEDKRLQFRNHADIFASRDEALTYFDNIVDVMHIYSTEFGDSLYSEPLVAKYLDESGETRVILAIGVDSGHTPYHIIDSTQLRELIQKNADDIVAETERAMAAENFLSGTLQTEIDRSIAKDEELQQQINDNKVKIESVAPSSENVLEEYSLTNALGEVLGTNIKIYKDQALVHAMIGFKGAVSVTVTEDGEYTLIYNEAERDESVEYLYLVYKDINGDLKLVGIDFERFLQEAEIGDGLKMEDHKVAIKIKDNEQFLTVDSNGLATSGLQDSINTAISGLSEEFLEKLNAEIERSTAADEYISGITSAFSAATVTEIESLKESDINLNKKIDNEIERATTREDELDAQLKTNKIVSKDVVLTPSESGTTLSIQVDEKTITKYASASTIYDTQVAVLGTLLKIKKVTPTESTVKYQFQLQDADGNMLGDEIKISNEGSLEKIEVGYVGDVIDPTTGQYASRGPNPDDHSLNFIYRLSDGTYSLTSIRIADYFTNELFGRGLNNQDGKISLLEGDGNEFLVIGEDTIAVVGVSNAIESAKTEAMQLSQDLYNAATAMTEEKATSALTYAMDKFAEATAYTFENVSSAFTYTTERFDAATSITQNGLNELTTKLNTDVSSAFTYTTNSFNAATAHTDTKFGEATAYTDTKHTESIDYTNQQFNNATSYTDSQITAVTKSITELSNTLSNALTTEITNRETADKDIISKIEVESETRHQEDTAIRKEITELTQTVNDKTFTIESNIDALSAVSHSHSNKDVLDAITSADTDSWRNAEKNAIESAKTYTDAQISSITSQLSIAYHYVGTVDTMEHLPASADVGSVYNVVLAHGNPGEPDYTPAGTNYAWNGVSWDALGGSVDLSSFATSERVEEIYDELSSVSGVSHTHANKDALDTITSDKIGRWDLTADEAIRGIYLNGEPIAPINNTVNIDLADYGNRDWVIEQIDKAIADFDKYGYATQIWVTAQINAASNVLQLQIDSIKNNFEEFEKHVIENYATSADTHNAIEKVAQDGKDYTDDQFDTINPVTEITQVTKLDTNYTSEEADKYQIDHHVDSKTIQLTYTPLSPLTLTVPETLGDIERGMSCEELNGMPLSQILDNIIFKTIYPTITQPTGSVSFKNGFSNNSIMEAGLAMPQDTNMNYSFNRGKVEVDDGVTEDIDYVGAATGVQYQVTYTPGTANANAGVSAGGSAFTGRALDGSKMTVGRYQFRGIISYGQGPVMATSKGNTPNPMRTNNAGNVTNPHPASSLTTSYNLTLNITLPVWIDNNADGSYNKQALKTWGAMTFTGVAMAGQNSGKPTRVKTPRKINTINSYNEVSGKYDVPQKSNYKMEEISETVNGVEVDYFEYTWIGGALDTVKFEIITY